MMKLNEIVLRYLKGQKKHTVLTVLAIIVSVAFMTIILSAVSVYRAASLNISRETNGTYHIVFNGLNKQQLIDIRSMDIFEKISKLLISSVLSARLPILALILSVVVVTQSFCPMNTVLSKD